MTKLRIMSDLHLEFGPLPLEPVGEDVLVLAGDIGNDTDGALWAIEYASRHEIPVVMIAGNHEFYRTKKRHKHSIESTLRDLHALAEDEDLFHFLENGIAHVNGVVFVGCTLWTDFKLNHDQAMGMWHAGNALNDYNLIMTDRATLRPMDVLRRHEFSAGWLYEQLPRNHKGDTPVVVITHHLPSARSLDGKYKDSRYNAGYASNLDDLVERSGAALWVHGHTHVSKDYTIGGTRIACNPRGYHKYQLNAEFDPFLLIDV